MLHAKRQTNQINAGQTCLPVLIHLSEILYELYHFLLVRSLKLLAEVINRQCSNWNGERERESLLAK